MLAFSLERQGPTWHSNATPPPNSLARIDKLKADMKLTSAQQQIARLQVSLMVVSLPQGLSLDTQ